ncbi:MAG: hypothetical protein ACFCBW_16135, partial [Candidatus Competibacterales bacterium]
DRDYLISRAHYRGELRDDALLWQAEFQVTLQGGGAVALPLLPVAVTVSDVRIDGVPALITTQGGRFAALASGTGERTVALAFQVPVTSADGPPKATVPLVPVPVSRLELTLPGHKQVSVTPTGRVESQLVDVPDAGEGEPTSATRAAVYAPLGEKVLFSWVDVLGDAADEAVSANAALYQAFSAEEGLLHGRVTAVFEVIRGQARQFALAVPPEVQVMEVVALEGGVADWAVTPLEEGEGQQLQVFLDRGVADRLTLDIRHERVLTTETGSLVLPLMRAQEVSRQRGMVALLSHRERTLNPVTTTGLTPVGENQLPAAVRNRLQGTVAHTFRHVVSEPRLLVDIEAPERQRGVFDAQVDGLISLGEVTLRGDVGVDIDVKTGTLLALALTLPGDVNVLGVSGPALRG